MPPLCCDEAILAVGCDMLRLVSVAPWVVSICCFIASVTVMVHSHICMRCSLGCKTESAVWLLMHVLCMMR